MEQLSLYFITPNGNFLSADISKLLVQSAEKFGKIKAVGQGSAYNSPIYLLGEIEGHESDSLVVAIDKEKDGAPRPRAFFGEEEIALLIEYLKENQDGDTWELAVELNKQIREEE